MGFKEIKSTFFWFPMATKEFFMQFWPGKNADNRDFFWLTILLSLLILFALLSLGTREGFSDRLVELLLGRVPGKGGIPVWVRSNPFSSGGRYLIDQKVIDQIQEIDNFKFYPYREIDHTMIDFFGGNVWKQASLAGDMPSFQGMAIYKDDPLWRYACAKQKITDEFHLVLNRSFVKSNLNYANYKENLKHVIPPILWQQIPDEKQFYSGSSMWLQVGAKKNLLKVSVSWVERIPIPGNVAFLMPLNVYHLLQVSHYYHKIRYFPESSGQKESFRITHIAVDKAINQQQQKELVDCLNAKYADKYGQLIFTLKNPLPKYVVDTCMQSSKISKEQYSISDEIFADRASQDSYWTLELPCKKVDPEILSSDDAMKCEQNSNYLMSYKIDHFIRGFVYVKDRTNLSDAIQKLQNIDGKPLLIPWTYSNAQRRFGALIYIIDVISKPFMALFFIFLAALMFIQTTTLIHHRRHNYGIFLSKGISRIDIYGIVMYQILIALVMGAGMAFLGYNLIRCQWINYRLVEIAQKFSDVLTLDCPDLLPMNVNHFILCLITEIIIGCLVVFIILYFLPLKKQTMPDKLL